MYHYSIIIPYRDCYPLLCKAVQSIPDRTDIQIIIVDNSLQPLCEKLPPKDAMETVSEASGGTDVVKGTFKKTSADIVYTTSDSTKGAGHARNVGLAQVKGDYILFCDADDYFTDDAFRVFDPFLESKNDITFFNATSVHLNSGEASTRHKEIDRMIKRYMRTGNEDPIRYHFEVPYCKLFRSDFILENQIKFDEVKYSNDTMFSIFTGSLAKQIYVKDAIVYVITEGESNKSLTKTNTEESGFVRYKVTVKQNQYYKSIKRPDQQLRLLPYIMKSWYYFGFKEFLKYIQYAKENKVSIFVGYL